MPVSGVHPSSFISNPDEQVVRRRCHGVLRHDLRHQRVRRKTPHQRASPRSAAVAKMCRVEAADLLAIVVRATMIGRWNR